MLARVFEVFRLSEVEPAGEFTDAEDVDATSYGFRTERGCMGEFGQAEAGAKVRKEAEMLAQREERAALGLLVRGEIFPLGAANRTEEDRIGLLADLQRLRRKGLPGTINRRTTDQGRGLLKLKSELFLNDAEDFGGLCHDFGSDAVSGQHCNAIGLAHQGMMHGIVSSGTQKTKSWG